MDKSTLNVAAYEQHGGKRGQLRFSTVDLAGELVVTDAERFATTLASGIGRAKAFGFSLLLVRKRSTNPILPRARYAVINCSALRCQGRRASKCSTVVAVGKARSMWRSHRYGSTLLALAVSTSE